MVRSKRVSRKEKRPASSTHSSQDKDSRPHKTPKPGENNSDSGSSIQMINSSNLRRYRENQRKRQQLTAQGQDEWNNPRGIRPPPGSGLQRRPQAVPQSSPQAIDEEGKGYEEEFEISYGGHDPEDRDQRISGWAGSVASAGAGYPNAGVEYDYASVQSSSPSPDGDEDDEGQNPENATEGEDAIPSIETGNVRRGPGAVAHTRAAVPAQPPTQNLRRSARLLHQNPHVSIALIPDTNFDLAAHLNKTAPDVRDLSKKYQQTSARIIACTAADFKARRQAFLDGLRPDTQKASVKPFNRGNFERLGRVFEANGVAIKSNEGGRDSTVDNYLRASEQNAAIEYFGRDNLANHGYVFASNGVSDNSNSSSSLNVSDAQAIHNRNYIPVSTFNQGGNPSSNEIRTCASAACPCHHAATPGLPRRYVIHVPGSAWVFHPTVESHHDRDYFPDSGYEQHNLNYGSEPREDRDHFPVQTCVLDYDGDAQMKEEPASEAGDYAEEGDGADDHGEDGSAGGDSPPADENGACDGGADDEDPEGGEQEKPEPSDSSSDGSDDDFKSDESVQGSEDPVVSEDEDGSAEKDGSDSGNGSDHAELQPDTTTTTQWRNTDPWGRIRPPQAQGIPSPPRLAFPSAQPYRPMFPQSGALGPRRDGATTSLITPNYDTTGAIRPPERQGLRLARRGGLANVPFAGSETRQNTEVNRMRDQPLSPGQGYVSVSIAEQQAAQMLHAYEGVYAVEGGDEEGEDGEGDDAEGEGEQGEGNEAEDGGAEDDRTGDGEAAGHV